MIQYFYNPRGQSLIIYDEEKREISVVERISSVRVFVGGEVALGDFGEDTERIARLGRRQEEGQYRNHNFDAGTGRAKRYKPTKTAKVRTCGNCHQPGHQARTCPDKQMPDVLDFLEPVEEAN